MITLALAGALTLVCDWGGSQVMVQPTKDGLNIELFNQTTPGISGPKTCGFYYGDIIVILTWDHTLQKPDFIGVTVSPGYYADHPDIVVPEASNATIKIHQEVMS